jgi:hypothetical protein
MLKFVFLYSCQTFSGSIDYLCGTKLRGLPANDSCIDKKEDAGPINEIAIFNIIHQGYKVYEVAEILGMPVEEVKVSIRKAMKQKTNPIN